jgi:hypothetical protein
MKLFATMPFCKPAAQQVPRKRAFLTLPQPLPGAEPVLDEAEAEPAACGWFDSSWALHAGLQITEHESVDRVVNELPLAWWLAWQPAPQACLSAVG